MAEAKHTQGQSKKKANATSIAPRPGEGKRGEEGHIGYLLRQAGAAYRLRLERALADVNITPPQFAVLTMLRAYPGFSNADIARIALLTPPTVTVIISNLERRGLVVKKAHTEHGRIQQISLAPSGSKLLDVCRSRAVTIEEDLLANLSRGEQELIKRWLVRIATQSHL